MQNTRMGGFIVFLLRFLIPPFILKWPLLFTILAYVADALDVVIIDLLDGRVSDFANLNRFYLTNYDVLDKILDQYYLIFAFLVVLRFKNKVIKNMLVFLFIYRLIGVILYEVTKNLAYLFWFANFFENVFLIYLIQLKLFKRDILNNRKNIGIALLIAIGLKMPQEYLLHMTQIPPWETIKRLLRIESLFQ